MSEAKQSNVFNCVILQIILANKVKSLEQFLEQFNSFQKHKKEFEMLFGLDRMRATDRTLCRMWVKMLEHIKAVDRLHMGKSNTFSDHLLPQQCSMLFLVDVPGAPHPLDDMEGFIAFHKEDLGMN